MRHLTNRFADALDQWLKAWKSGDHAHAAAMAEEVRLTGDLLAVRPEFNRCFKQVASVDARQALHLMSQFLACLSDREVNGSGAGQHDGASH